MRDVLRDDALVEGVELREVAGLDLRGHGAHARFLRAAAQQRVVVAGIAFVGGHEVGLSADREARDGVGHRQAGHGVVNADAIALRGVNELVDAAQRKHRLPAVGRKVEHAHRVVFLKRDVGLTAADRDVFGLDVEVGIGRVGRGVKRVEARGAEVHALEIHRDDRREGHIGAVENTGRTGVRRRARAGHRTVQAVGAQHAIGGRKQRAGGIVTPTETAAGSRRAEGHAVQLEARRVEEHHGVTAGAKPHAGAPVSADLQRGRELPSRAEGGDVRGLDEDRGLAGVQH